MVLQELPFWQHWKRSKVEKFEKVFVTTIKHQIIPTMVGRRRGSRIIQEATNFCKEDPLWISKHLRTCESLRKERNALQKLVHSLQRDLTSLRTAIIRLSANNNNNNRPPPPPPATSVYYHTYSPSPSPPRIHHRRHHSHPPPPPPPPAAATSVYHRYSPSPSDRRLMLY